MEKINIKAIKEVNKIDVRQVSPISYLVHQLSGVGKYVITLQQGRRKVNSVTVNCIKNSEVPSVNVDIGAIAKSPRNKPIVIGEESRYLLFYNSNGFEDYRIIIRKGRSIEFDSYKPKKGDLFALNLLKAGEYAVESKSLKKSTTLKVGLDLIEAGENPQSLVLNQKDLVSGKTANIATNQGFTIDLDEDMADLTITLKKATKIQAREQLKADLKKRMHQKVKLKSEFSKQKYRINKLDIR